VALAGVSAAIALAADVPVEVLSDVPGIGQLAWQAAMGRDLPLLVSLTLLVTAVVQLSNALADLAAETWQRGRG
jgi:peptide/nickel transport system permease protein